MNYRLVLSDVDSTLIANEVIDLLAAYSGEGERVAKITERAMNGEIDFEAALRERVSLLEGLSEEVCAQAASEISFNPGAWELRDFCKENGIKFGVVTGGFYEVLNHIPFFAELDYLRANSLEIFEGKLTGSLHGEVIDRSGKARHLENFAKQNEISLSQTIAIGDGANDLAMIQAAGIGIAFRAKQSLKDVADLAIEKSLAEVIPLL